MESTEPDKAGFLLLIVLFGIAFRVNHILNWDELSPVYYFQYLVGSGLAGGSRWGAVIWTLSV